MGPPSQRQCSRFRRGCGRWAAWAVLLQHGSTVTFVDKKTANLEDLTAHDKAIIIAADLEDGTPWPFENNAFDAIVVVNYLHRALFPNLIASLKPQGVLIYETFAVGNEKYGRPNAADFLLKPEELLEHTRGLMKTVAYEHGLLDNHGQLSVKQSLCAIKNPT